MFKNYIKIALRNLLKHKGYSLINIVGLAVGITCCSLIFLYVYDELNFDRFHAKSERIYRAIEKRQSPDMGIRHLGITAPVVGQTLVEEFPEVEKTVRFFRPGRFTVRHGDRRFYEGDYFITEPSFFEVFDFELLKGNPQTVLLQPSSVVLTEKAAKKYFGKEDPFGKTLILRGEHEFKVTGILRDPPHNFHLNFNMLISLATFESDDYWKQYLSSWDSDYCLTYVVLNDARVLPEVEAKLPELVEKYRGEKAEMRQVYLQALADIHFHSAQIEFDRNQAKGDIAYIYIFTAIGIFIALIASINYMNLSTARSMNRAKEVGMRKVIGARRRQLVGQFMSEALVLTLIAFVIACALVQLAIPVFNQISGKALAVDFKDVSLGLLPILVIAMMVGFLSGSYPAFYLSGLRPMLILKGHKKSSTKAAFLRHGLVVTQFVLSIIMIIATTVVYNQLQYIQNKQLGFDREHLLVVDINSGGVRRDFAAMKTEFVQCPGVQSVAVSSRVPGEWKDLTEAEINLPGMADTEVYTMNFIGIDEGFLETYSMELLEGRNFSGSFGSDSLSVILNEAAVKMLGLDSPLGKRIRIPEENFEPQVIGVAKDFHFRSLHERIGPLVLGYRSNPVRVIDYFTARIDGSDIPATLWAMEEVHDRFDEITPFEYNFLDEKLNRYYGAEIRAGQLFAIAASMAIFIACLGLFGLAAYTAEQRTREIGVRKVLGASVSGIVLLLSKDFTRLVLIAIMVAAPIAYYLMNQWLANFAYRVDIGAGIFLLTAALALLIALLTVSYQAIRAALANPAKALRYE
jgi:putative ABC transport system permease protein